MVKRDYRHWTIARFGLQGLAMKLRNRFQFRFQAKKPDNVFHGKPAERSNDLRLDYFNLSFKKRPVDLNFFGQRVAVKWRSVFNNIGDINLRAFDTDRFQKLIQYFTGGADEWPAGLSFIPAWCFPYEHYLSLVTAIANDRKNPVLYPLLIKRRFFKRENLVFNFS